MEWFVVNTSTFCGFNLLSALQECCYQYWPTTAGKSVQFGEYTVELTSEEVLTGFTIRTLDLLNTKVIIPISCFVTL